MLRAVFHVLGGLLVIAGICWSMLAFFSSAQAPLNNPDMAAVSLLARGFVAWPGLVCVFTGMLLLATAEALGKLDRIARSSAKTAISTADIAKAMTVAKPRPDAADNFNDAIQLFQAKTGKAEPGTAIRELATDALRQQGYLR